MLLKREVVLGHELRLLFERAICVRLRGACATARFETRRLSGFVSRVVWKHDALACREHVLMADEAWMST